MIVPHIRYGFLLALLLACGGERPAHLPDDPPPRPDGERGRVVFLGTSLTAGLGLDPANAYPALIQAKIDSAGLPYTAVNAGVSGETSAGALRRVDWLLQQPVAVLVIETGANDGLRGLPADSLRSNIDAILTRAHHLQPNAKLVLAGMKIPPNYGRAYSQQFEAIYPQLARAHGATLVPFLLEGVGGISSLNQADGVHPTAEGQRRMAETMWRVLEPVLKDAARTDSREKASG